MLNLRENLPHSDEITSLYQVAAAPPQPTPIRRAAACGGVAPAARVPGAAAPSRACAGAGCRGAALAVCACPRGRARCPPPGGLRAPLPAAPQSGAAAGLCGASAAAAASRSVPRGARPPGPLFPRLSALGACAASFPLRVARRLAVLGLGRPRRARAPLRRGPAVGRPRGGFWRPLRRPPLWRFAPPRVGLGFRRCGCSSPAVRRASQCLPRSAYGAMLFKEKLSCKASREAQHIVPVCCSTYKISCEFGKTRIILPNYLCILSIDTAPCFCYAHIRN